MRFRLDQVLPGSVQEVLAAFVDPGYLASLGELAKVGAPELLDQQPDGDLVRQRVRYRFTGDLAPTVTRVVDPDRLVWVDEHTYDLARGTATFRIVPEHYADRLACTGTERFDAVAGGANRHVEAELEVRWPIVGGLVERAIVSGLKEHLADESELIARWLGRPLGS